MATQFQEILSPAASEPEPVSGGVAVIAGNAPDGARVLIDMAEDAEPRAPGSGNA